MRRPTLVLLAAFLCACPLVTEGNPAFEDSSSSSGDSESGDVPADDDADDGGSTDGEADDGPDPGTSSEDGGESSEGDSEADDESSSTGEPVTDFALHFNGLSSARKASNDGSYGWTHKDFTIETWIEIEDEDATGVIFDAQDGYAIGLSFYLHPEWHSLVFSFYDDSHENWVVTGPQVASIGVGWHHVAVTKNGDTVYLHVDGVTEEVDTVGEELFYAPVTLTIGAIFNYDDVWSLKHANLDDLRITALPIYDSNFEPPVVVEDTFENQGVLLVDFDEGDGILASDSISFMQFEIDDPEWVTGNY